MLTREMAHEILDIAMDINGGLERRYGKGHPTVIMRYFGPINEIGVAVYEEGYVSGLDLDFVLRFEDYETLEESEKEMNKLRDLRTELKCRQRAKKFASRFKGRRIGGTQ